MTVSNVKKLLPVMNHEELSPISVVLLHCFGFTAQGADISSFIASNVWK